MVHKRWCQCKSHCIFCTSFVMFSEMPLCVCCVGVMFFIENGSKRYSDTLGRNPNDKSVQVPSSEIKDYWKTPTELMELQILEVTLHHWIKVFRVACWDLIQCYSKIIDKYLWIEEIWKEKANKRIDEQLHLSQTVKHPPTVCEKTLNHSVWIRRSDCGDSRLYNQW